MYPQYDIRRTDLPVPSPTWDSGSENKHLYDAKIWQVKLASKVI